VTHRLHETRAQTVGHPGIKALPRERRFITVGMSSAGRVLMVAHADRDENIRIISARKTTAREREQYEEKS
jgi:uncharacterized DUF497 family protein